MNKNLHKLSTLTLVKFQRYLTKSSNCNNAFKIPNDTQNIGKGRSFFVKTYGCQANIRDTETIEGILKLLGFVKSNELLKADLILLNTCAVRENAEKKVFGEIGFLKKLKSINPKFLFGICGCMPQKADTVKKIFNQNTHIDLIFGTHNIHALPMMLNQVINQQQRFVQTPTKENKIIENLPVNRFSKIKAYVNIMWGCDKFCTYCIVPYTRGRIRSRLKNEIINEVETLIQAGYKEVTLLGQNVNNYGIDLYKKYHFADLLNDVANTKILRLRFVTSNPWNFDKKIVKVMQRHSNIMPYIHLPIQSGDQNILKKMNRSMKIKDYYELISYIRKRLPTCAISTDIIVGFPNETAQEFDNTIKMYQDLKFDNAYTFIYSPRTGTPAALIEDKIDLQTKKKRLYKLNELVKYYAKLNNEKWVDKIVEVLVEGFSKTNSHLLTGYTPEWKIVNFKGKAQIGDIVKVQITSASRFSLNGKMI